MSATQALYQTLQAQATLDQTAATTADTRALAQQRLQQVQIMANTLQQNVATNRALQQALAGASAMPTGMYAAPDDTPVQAANKNIQRMQWQAEQSQKLADTVAANGGNPQTVLNLRKEADTANQRLFQSRREALAERGNLSAQIASAAGGASEATLPLVIERLNGLDPQIVPKLMLDKDAYGAPAWGPKTESTMLGLNRMGQTSTQQNTMDLKAADLQRKQEDLERKRDYQDMRGNLLDAQTKLAQERGLTEQSRRDLNEARAGKAAQGGSTGSKASTGPQVKAAKAAVQAEFPDAEFDASIDRFAADVADRANKIRADAKTTGEDIGMDDARDQALNELKGYVTDRTKVIKAGVDLPLLGNVGGKTQTLKTYTRSGASKAAQSGETTPEIKDQAGYDALPKGASYLFNGKPGIKR